MQPVGTLTMAREELQQLMQLQVTLGAALNQHAVQLQRAGALPSEELIDQLREFRTRLLQVWSGVPSADQLQSVSVDSLQEAIESYETRARCGQILQQVLALTHVDDPAFAGLIACQAAARSLQGKIETGSISLHDAEIEQLLAGTHSYQSLLRLVLPGAELSDEEWAACQEQVGVAWGRSLATAAVRGRILVFNPPELSTEEAAIPVACDLSNSPLLQTPDLTEAVPTPTETVSPPSTQSSCIHDSDVQIDAMPDGSLAQSGLESAHTYPANLDALNKTTSETTNESLPSTSSLSDVIASNVAQEPYAFEMRGNGTESIDSVFESGQDSIFDTIGKPTQEQPSAQRSRSLDLKLMAEDPYHWAKSQPIRAARIPPALSGRGNIGILAHRALQSDMGNRRTLVSQVILQLLWDDRPALAYHLTRGDEGGAVRDQSVLPAWTMHALTLCRQLCFAKGEIARQIEDDLKQFRPDLLNVSSPDANEATGFFLRAAALIPALLMSSPTAAAILRSFKISPGLSHLYNYCSRILNHGQQLQGQAADLFTPDCDVTKWGEERQSLQREVETWLPDMLKRYASPARTSLLFLHAHWTLTASPTVRHEEAARIWRKWQEVFRIVYGLLKPILSGNESERNWVKSEIDRLTSSIRLETSAPDSGITLTGATLSFPDESMLTVIREAIDFASRWMRLCASKPAQGRTLASRDAEALRDEILERTDAVIAELAAYSQSHDQPRTRAAIACLCRTIEHLRTIFSPHSTLAFREPDPRHVVSGELLKIPNLRLNEQWLPTVDAAALEAEILTHLTNDQCDWRQAFDQHSAQHDHVATGRILELNVWRNEQERAAFAERREREIDICRRAMGIELEAVTNHLAEVLSRNVLGDQARSTLEQRLDRVRTMANHTVDFADLQREILGIRLAIDQRLREALHAALPKPTVKERSSVYDQPERTPSPPKGNAWAWDVFGDE